LYFTFKAIEFFLVTSLAL